MKDKTCEAILGCNAQQALAGQRCPETFDLKVVDGRCLCWVHRMNVLRPEPRKHLPQKFMRAHGT